MLRTSVCMAAMLLVSGLHTSTASSADRSRLRLTEMSEEKLDVETPPGDGARSGYP